VSNNRKWIESRPNWFATFERTNPEALERFDCLMTTISGGFYWYTPDYQGLFPSGATRECNLRSLQFSLTNKYLKLVAGKLPQGVKL
jgi:hypothetical protein